MKYLTETGAQKIRDELELRVKKRKEIAQAIKEAKELGDLSENAEYTEAKSQQRENESRVIYLENIIRTYKIVEKKGCNGKVDLDSIIEVQNKTLNKKMTFHIVGSNEADPVSGKISNESPIGKAFLGKKKGDKVKIVLANGKKISYKILKLK
ncbi:MAG: transcription elongation factor GreA [Candidatus Moranbacteria bacterium]|nr:transcription elongation factor GreA [Candidatus Moranbacteria bacterium]